MIGKPYLGLRRCEATVRVLFGPQRKCSNPASRVVGDRLLCEKHSRGDAVKVTIEFEMDVLDSVDTAKLVLAMKRSIDRAISLGAGELTKRAECAHGTIVDTDGAVIGMCRIQHTKKRKKAA
jgi:hypothetical protein